MEVWRLCWQSTTILFPLIDFGAQDFESTPVTFAAGDTQISKNEGAFANTTNNPVHEGNGIYSLLLTGTEMAAARVVITAIDQTSPKAWEDQAVIVSTYGHAIAQHTLTAWADVLLGRDVDNVEATAAVHSLVGAVLKNMSRVDASSGANIITYRTDGSTTFATQAISDSASGPDIITEQGVAS